MNSCMESEETEYKYQLEKLQTNQPEINQNFEIYRKKAWESVPEKSKEITQKMDDGRKVTGILENCVIKKGLIHYSNGDKYEGFIRDGQARGQGKIWYSNGDIYTGSFRYDLKDGQGDEIFANGNHYSGGFHRGKFEGKGIFKFANGNIFTGIILIIINF